jgi:hypothetical protein
MITLASLRSDRWTAWPEPVDVFIGIRSLVVGQAKVIDAGLPKHMYMVGTKLTPGNGPPLSLLGTTHPPASCNEQRGCSSNRHELRASDARPEKVREPLWEDE